MNYKSRAFKSCLQKRTESHGAWAENPLHMQQFGLRVSLLLLFFYHFSKLISFAINIGETLMP